MDISVD